MHYVEAYEKADEELRRLLSEATDQESGRSFVEEGVGKLKAAAAATPEFYVGEFYHGFQKAMRDDAKAEEASCERETEHIVAAGERATADLNARLDAARAAGDQDLEHAIWKEGELTKAENQAAVDALTRRMTVGILRLRLVDQLGVALGGRRAPSDHSVVATTATNPPREEGDSNMRTIETAVRKNVAAGAVLSTPTGRGTFIVADIGMRGPVLLLGRKQARTLIPWAALEGVPAFLSTQGWAVIGSVYDQAADPTTLDGYMKRFVNRATAGWVACLLEAAGVVQIDRRQPARVRLRPDFLSTEHHTSPES